MGGFGSGRHGGSVTAEGTASYIIAISSFRSFLQKGECLTGAVSFNGGRFPIVITFDLTNEWNCFVELIHSTRDEREGDRIVTGRVQAGLDRADLWRPTLVVFVPQDRPPHHKAFSAEWWLAFLSRQAYGLGYACQREDRFGRLQRRAAALNSQLGGGGWETWDVPPQKPKWIRWRTYERKYERREKMVEKANEEFVISAKRLLNRH